MQWHRQGQCSSAGQINKLIKQAVWKNISSLKSHLYIFQVALKCRQIGQDFENNKRELARLEQMIKLQQDALTHTNKNQEMAIQRRNFL